MKILKQLKEIMQNENPRRDPVLHEAIDAVLKDHQKQAEEYHKVFADAMETIEALQDQVEDLQFSLNQAKASADFKEKFRRVDQDVIGSLLKEIEELKEEVKETKDSADCALICHEYERTALKRIADAQGSLIAHLKEELGK